MHIQPVYNVYTHQVMEQALWLWDGNAIGRTIKRERERRDPRVWTQRFLAKKAGVSHAYVSHLEAGFYKRPSRAKVEKILAALDLDLRAVSEAEAQANGGLVEERSPYDATDPSTEELHTLIDQIASHGDLGEEALTALRLSARALESQVEQAYEEQLRVQRAERKRSKQAAADDQSTGRA
jgi:transcriptional regulator with XRE-family HTH domain